jgi:hypothetical protein
VVVSKSIGELPQAGQVVLLGLFDPAECCRQALKALRRAGQSRVVATVPRWFSIVLAPLRVRSGVLA